MIMIQQLVFTTMMKVSRNYMQFSVCLFYRTSAHPQTGFNRCLFLKVWKAQMAMFGL